MVYEIPQKLQYEEKVIFGLTFRQLSYAAVFLLPTLLWFMKSKLNIYLKASICTVPITIAVLFMFFNFKEYLKNIITWSKFREVFITDDKMFRFIGIEKVIGGVIYVS